MKTKIATTLSIVGVLTAGSAAALVNTQILDSGPTESGASKAVLPPASTVALTVPEIELPALDETTTTMPTTTSSPSTSSSTTTVAPAPEPTGYLTAFNVGEAGVVTVDVIDGQLVLISAEPKPGWTVTKAEDDSNDDSDDDDNEVEVEFVSATVRVEFEASFVDGQIVPRVESEAIAPATTVAPAPAPAPSTTAPHYDDDDEYDDDEYDERDDDDEYDERDDDDREDERDHDDEDDERDDD